MSHSEPDRLSGVSFQKRETSRLQVAIAVQREQQRGAIVPDASQGIRVARVRFAPPTSGGLQPAEGPKSEPLHGPVARVEIEHAPLAPAPAPVVEAAWGGIATIL